MNLKMIHGNNLTAHNSGLASVGSYFGNQNFFLASSVRLGRQELRSVFLPERQAANRCVQ